MVFLSHHFVWTKGVAMAGNVQEWMNFLENEFWYNQDMDIYGSADYSWCLGGSMQAGSSSLRCYTKLYWPASFTMVENRATYFDSNTGFRVCRRVP